MPKVSIIIPTYNRASYLKEAIESILCQSFQDFNIIVTDNASTDDTEKVVIGFKSSKIFYHKNPTNIGVVNNHNKALELANGEYIAVFSDDDLMLTDSLLKRVEILDKYKSVDLVHSNIEIINEKGEIIGLNHWAKSYCRDWDKKHKEDVLFEGIDYFKILYYEWNVISMPSVMFRKSVTGNVSGFNSKSKYFCDWDLWMKICLFGDVYYLSQQLVKYRVHSSNTIKEISDDINKKELILIKNMLFDKYAYKLIELYINKNEIDETVNTQIGTYPIVLKSSGNLIINKIKKLISAL